MIQLEANDANMQSNLSCFTFVILSEAKDLSYRDTKMLHIALNDRKTLKTTTMT